MPNPNFALNYDDFMRQVNPLLNGGNSWQQKDGDPYGLNLQLADGRTWNPSGSQSGVTYRPAGSTSGGEWVNNGMDGQGSGYYTPTVTNPNESWEVSGDLSALNGAPGSRKHTNIRYERQGDKLMPVNQSDWDWVSPWNDIKNIGLLAATAAGAGYGFDALNAAIGAGGGGGGAAFGGGGGSAAGGAGAGTGVFSASPELAALMGPNATMADLAMGSQMAAGAGAGAGALATGSGLLGTAAEALNALKTATGMSTADLLKLGGGLVGGLLGSQSSSPNKALSQRLMDTPMVGNPFADGRATLRQPNFNFGGWQPR
jgi:hypothetical protein